MDDLRFRMIYKKYVTRLPLYIGDCAVHPSLTEELGITPCVKVFELPTISHILSFVL